MKPINNDNPSCNPISSECVIWQGDDIACINLCKGDTVSDVVFKLATELCSVLDILKITSYDLSCFNLTSCAPTDYEELIQFLIDRVCNLEQCTGCIPQCGVNSPANSSAPGKSKTNTGSGCPDCVISIAPCFYYQNAFGDTITSMQLVDYVHAIGNKVCDLVSQITTIQSQIASLDIRVTNLENTPPPVLNLPTLVPQCVLPPSQQPMLDVLVALESQFCQLQGATGTPISLYQNIVKQCAGLNTAPQLGGTGGIMSSIPGWTSTVNNVAQSIGNLWLTICDMRMAIRNIQLNCCPTACDGIELSINAILVSNILSVYVNGTVPVGFVQCNSLGTTITITDSNGNSTTFTYDLLAYINNPTGYPANLSGTGLDISLDLTIVIQPCLIFTETGTTCQSYLSYILSNSALCPAFTLSSTMTTISYNFTSSAGSYTYTIELWDNAGVTLIVNQTQVISGVNPVSGMFSGLTAGTTYKIRTTIVATACVECTPVVCPFTPVTTVAPPCLPPDSVVPSIP